MCIRQEFEGDKERWVLCQVDGWPHSLGHVPFTRFILGTQEGLGLSYLEAQHPSSILTGDPCPGRGQDTHLAQHPLLMQPSAGPYIEPFCLSRSQSTANRHISICPPDPDQSKWEADAIPRLRWRNWGWESWSKMEYTPSNGNHLTGSWASASLPGTVHVTGTWLAKSYPPWSPLSSTG